MKNTESIISLISTIRDKANKLIISELENNNIYGLAPSHGNILQVLYHTKEPLTMQNIAAKINRDKSTLTSLVNKLVKLGYLLKLRNADDNRITIITLTQKAWELEPIFNDISTTLLQKVYQDFTNTQKEEVTNALKKINRNL